MDWYKYVFKYHLNISVFDSCLHHLKYLTVLISYVILRIGFFRVFLKFQMRRKNNCFCFDSFEIETWSFRWIFNWERERESEKKYKTSSMTHMPKNTWIFYLRQRFPTLIYLRTPKHKKEHSSTPKWIVRRHFWKFSMKILNCRTPWDFSPTQGWEPLII